MSAHEAGLERDAIERLRQGQIDGLELLVHLHQTQAIRTAYLITRDLGAAQDIVQSAFLRAYERIDQFDPGRPFGPSFCTSVVRDAIKLTVRRARHTSVEVDSISIVDSGGDPEALWEQAETSNEVWAAMGRLTAEQRAAIVARSFHGLSEAEMSRALASPQKHVEMATTRGAGATASVSRASNRE